MNINRFSSSPIIAGCMRWGSWGAGLEPKGYLTLIENCLESGIDTFDHADIYGGPHLTETAFGKALQMAPGIREKIKIITKTGIMLPDKLSGSPMIKHYDTSESHLIQSVEESLKALQTDRIDLLLIHRPDPLMDPEIISQAFHRLKKAGKVLHFGVSNFKASQLALIHRHWPVEVNQIQVSVEQPGVLFDGTTDKCLELGVQIQAWSPFAGGKITEISDDERLRKIHAVAKLVATRHQTGVHEVLIAWLRTLPLNIIPILGSSNIERIRTINGSTGFTLEREEWFMMLRASTGKDVD
jgi:predicted oxidoreductase